MRAAPDLPVHGGSRSLVILRFAIDTLGSYRARVDRMVSITLNNGEFLHIPRRLRAVEGIGSSKRRTSGHGLNLFDSVWSMRAARKSIHIPR